MKESIGALGLTNIVIVFIILFSGYMCLSINQTKAYNVKNEIINIIQKHNGLDNNTIDEIADYMSSVGYRSKGKCESFNNEDNGHVWVGYVNSSANNNPANYCIMTIDVTDNLTDKYNQFPRVRYYKVKVFFSLDIPIIGNALSFSLSGTTKNIYYPIEEPYKKGVGQ